MEGEKKKRKGLELRAAYLPLFSSFTKVDEGI
jgi:hypothetical protein